jgi:cbb3-type cytochrome oxidase cytochrome c subunit
MNRKIFSLATIALFCITLALGLFALTGGAHEEGPPPEHQAWPSAGDAPAIYWVLVILVGGGLLGFIFWSLYGKMRPGRLSTSNVSYHALGVLVIFMTLFTLVLYIIPANQARQIEPTERAWNFHPGEKIKDPGGSNIEGEPYRGYLVYLANGCQYCHTLYLRTEDIKTGWAEGARPEEVSQIGDYVNYPFTMLGTQRDGPDLTVIGRKIPDMKYQIDHLIDPRKFKPKSVMPTYKYLSDQDLKDLAAYLVSLGNDPKKLREGAVIPPPPPTESPLVEKGKGLYRSLGCIGCHTVDGTASTGPTWLGTFGAEHEVQLPDGTSIQIKHDEAYTRESIVQPGAKVVKGFPNIMPPYPNLSEEELQAIIEYIKTLRGEHSHQ